MNYILRNQNVEWEPITALGRDLWPTSSDVVKTADIMVCVDVDERLTIEGVEQLARAMAANPSAIAVQARKHDAPVTNSVFGRAFAANYDAWFWWEANTSALSGSATSSYYGSMAAIRLAALTGAAEGEECVVPIDYAVEDFPLFVLRMSRLSVRLLDVTIGYGDAPVDYWAYYCLWRRWVR